MSRFVLITSALALILGGCNSTTPPRELPSVSARAHIQNFVLDVDPRDNGLNWTQNAQLAQIANEYKARGHGPLVIAYPEGTGQTGALVQTVAHVRRSLNEMGLPWQAIHGSTLKNQAGGSPFVQITFRSYVAVADQCPEGWSDMRWANLHNDHPRFGCATAANMAAMVSDPHDFLAPRGQDSVNTGRRQTVIDAYKAGEQTASERNPGESGAVSDISNGN